MTLATVTAEGTEGEKRTDKVRALFQRWEGALFYGVLGIPRLRPEPQTLLEEH